MLRSYLPVLVFVGIGVLVGGAFAVLNSIAGRKVVLIDENHVVDSLAAGNSFSFVKITPAHLEALNQLLPAERAATYAHALIVGGEALHGETVDFWKRNAPVTRIVMTTCSPFCG